VAQPNAHGQPKAKALTTVQFHACGRIQAKSTNLQHLHQPPDGRIRKRFADGVRPLACSWEGWGHLVRDGAMYLVQLNIELDDIMMTNIACAEAIRLGMATCI